MVAKRSAVVASALLAAVSGALGLGGLSSLAGAATPQAFETCPVGASAYSCSNIWAGAVESGQSFTSVTAQWQVPSVAPLPAPASAGMWVGIGGDQPPGVPQQPLIQDGTGSTVTLNSNGSTSVQYDAWWEVYPGGPSGLPKSRVLIKGPVHAGDTVTAAVVHNPSGSWTMSLDDRAAGIHFRKTVTVANSSSETTAEWIVERPTLSPGVQGNLADFGSMQFTNIGATTSGTPTMTPNLIADSNGNVLAYGTSSSSSVVTVTEGALPPGPPPTPTPPGPGPVPPPTPPPDAVPAGYWEVGGDGGVFAFGDAGFYGSTGNLALQRPVVSMASTLDLGGYWLAASDGGVFAFGDADYNGSIPGLGIAPADTPGAARALNAPIVGVVPAPDGGGYLMVGADGGVFAFGDATYAGSCPTIGGCLGKAVALMPDGTGNGYWVVTDEGYVYAFGDAGYFGAPGPGLSPVTSAVATPDGAGYWVIAANGAVFAYGDAAYQGAPVNQALGGATAARAIVSTADGQGYWVIAADGAVFAYGDATYQGGMAGLALNAPIVAAAGW